MRTDCFGFYRARIGHIEWSHGRSYSFALQQRWKSDNIWFFRWYREYLGHEDFYVSFLLLRYFSYSVLS